MHVIQLKSDLLSILDSYISMATKQGKTLCKERQEIVFFLQHLIYRLPSLQLLKSGVVKYIDEITAKRIKTPWFLRFDDWDIFKPTVLDAIVYLLQQQQQIFVQNNLEDTVALYKEHIAQMVFDHNNVVCDLKKNNIKIIEELNEKHDVIVKKKEAVSNQLAEDIIELRQVVSRYEAQQQDKDSVKIDYTNVFIDFQKEIMLCNKKIEELQVENEKLKACVSVESRSGL